MEGFHFVPHTFVSGRSVNLHLVLQEDLLFNYPDDHLLFTKAFPNSFDTAVRRSSWLCYLLY